MGAWGFGGVVVALTRRKEGAASKGGQRRKHDGNAAGERCYSSCSIHGKSLQAS